MELKDCPLCGSKPLLLSENDVACVSGLCPAKGLVVDRRIWNLRAEVAGRDSQILRELKLEHSTENNLNKIRSRYPQLS
ncbi:hypothetical protein [Spirochaeta isovalerica]|uniref:Uncharacterized protein n=1 Tax=Spirochaeta isovalerica TaxID=150 RepID=A0A841RB36_9SPIO|nr:hypothetical protein [Spirochaeta isovalerica]MBB6480571.1 hypothetical protein [Spirochaeta isovalerica]